MIFIHAFLLSLALLGAANAYDDPVVHLDYGTFQGKYDTSYNLSYFRKIPFAAPPTGQNRFRAPQPPLKLNSSIYDTDQAFDMCPQRTVNGSEDCLYLGLYSRPWDQSDDIRRPVLVAFYGGAFIEGDALFGIPPNSYPVLNASTLNDYIVIYPNYRTNAFGFLPGKSIKESATSDLNPGLLDQQYALKWVQENIDRFGGNPKNVSIWGQSAGGGSVVALILANGRNGNPKLFSKALASSPFWPKSYRYDEPEAEAIYNQLANLTGCAGSSHERETLDCLKSIDVQTIRDASLIIDSDSTYTTSSYTWAPVIDGEFLHDTLTDAVSSGTLNTEYIWGMYNTHEGQNFIPPGLNDDELMGGYNSSAASFHEWLVGFLPGLSSTQIEQVENVHYPAVGSTETITEYNTTYIRAGLIYRDVVLSCPAYWVASAALGRGYVGEYSIAPATHGSDAIYWNTVNSAQKTNPVVYEGYAGAFASFFQTGDPNAHRLTNSSESGVPDLQKTKEEFVVFDYGFGTARLTQLEKRCNFWRRIGQDIPI